MYVNKKNALIQKRDGEDSSSTTPSEDSEERKQLLHDTIIEKEIVTVKTFR